MFSIEVNYIKTIAFPKQLINRVFTTLIFIFRIVYYQKFDPGEHLKPYVECIYLWQQNKLKEPLLIRSPPTGFAALIFNLGAPYKTGLLADLTSLTPSVFFTGQADQSYFLELSQTIDVVGIVFKPTGLFRLFKLQLPELTNRRLDATLVLKNVITETWEQLGEAATNENRVSIVKNLLTKRLVGASYHQDAIDDAVAQILENNGLNSMSSLMSQYSISSRQFQRKFLQKVGVSPKFYSKLRRFSYICSLLIQQQVIDWHEIVWLGGYYDQSHFIKDFLSFMKENPTAYYENPIELLNFLE